MKRIISVLAVLAMISLVSCDNKKDNEKPNADTTSVVTEAVGDEVTATPEKSEKTEVSLTTETKTEVVTATSNGENFGFPDNDPEFEKKLDGEVIAAAQIMYEKACETEWNFTVGSPYSLDTNEYITNDYDWRFYLVTDENIKSIADVKADFHKIFSNEYKDSIDELYKEKGGRVYCLDGARGSNLFYKKSEITEITGRSEGEIRFNAVSYYDETEYGGKEYTEESEFVIVREADGSWKVQTFKLPY